MGKATLRMKAPSYRTTVTTSEGIFCPEHRLPEGHYYDRQEYLTSAKESSSPDDYEYPDEFESPKPMGIDDVPSWER